MKADISKVSRGYGAEQAAGAKAFDAWSSDREAYITADERIKRDGAEWNKPRQIKPKSWW